MRGYAPTAVPAEPRYSAATLGLDANRLHEALGGGPDAVLVGHDWGAIAAYPAAAAGPDRWRRVVTMAVPPGPAMGGLLTYDQLKRSFYMWFFQLPLADFIVPSNDFDFIVRLWQDWSPGHDGAEDVDHVRDALRDPANLGAALGYYRTAFGTATPPPPDPDVAAVEAAAGGLPPRPLLYLHGRTDGCMGADLAAAAEPFLQAPSRMVMVEGAGHFLHVEKPDEVNGLILDFLAES
jgi:pimeloyl-ACP methyl ester carboxylesterase